MQYCKHVGIKELTSHNGQFLQSLKIIITSTPNNAMTKEDVLNEIQWLPMSALELNEGQLEGVPRNPRGIRRDKYERLLESIRTMPDYLERNRMKVFQLPNGHYIIIGGNMRFRAMSELGHTTAPVTVLPSDTPTETLCRIALIDNAGFGEWDWDMLANEWPEDMLTDSGIDIPIASSDMNPDDFFDNIANATADDKGIHITVVIPPDMNDQKDEIKSAIESAIAGYSGIKIK